MMAENNDVNVKNMGFTDQKKGEIQDSDLLGKQPSFVWRCLGFLKAFFFIVPLYCLFAQHADIWCEHTQQKRKIELDITETNDEKDNEDDENESSNEMYENNEETKEPRTDIVATKKESNASVSNQMNENRRHNTSQPFTDEGQ